MVVARFQRWVGSLQRGVKAGLTAGLVMLYLILIGIPLHIPSLALFALFLVVAIFSMILARRLHEASLGDLLKNALALGVTAALVIFLFMSLINRWQARGIDVKQYLDAVNTETTSMLSGVPAAELHPNPPVDPMTGTYLEGQPVRTNPMRLTFDPDTGLILKLGLTGSAWVKVNLVIGGLYGFLLLLVVVALLGALLVRGAIYLELARYRANTSRRIAAHPLTHRVVLILPLLVFAFLWLTQGQGTRAPLISFGDGSQEVQLLISFSLILVGLVAIRSAQPDDWNLGYSTRVVVNAGIVIGLGALGLWRITGNHTYFIALPSEPTGSETYSILVLLLVLAILIIQNALALRTAGRFETQLAVSTMAGTMLLMPLYLDQYQNDVLTLVGINILLGLGLNIVVGYAGMLVLGYGAFFALGAYTYAFLASNQYLLDANNQPTKLKFAGNDEMVIKIAQWSITALIVTVVVLYVGLYLWRRSPISQQPPSPRKLLKLTPRPTSGTTLLLLGVAITTSVIVASLLDGSQLYQDLFASTSPFLVGLLTALIVSALVGIVLGVPVLRLRGDYLAIVTLGFGEITRLLFNNLRDLTGGPQGVLQIPRPLPAEASGSPTFLTMVYLVFIGAALVAFLSIRLQQSRLGRAWSAMRSDEDIARSMGVNLVQVKLTAFAIGAAFAGIGGVLFAARQRNIFPGDFKLDVSIEVLSLVIIGGMGSIPGVIMGAVVLIGIPEVLRELATYRVLAFGALLITMVIIRPSGLLPAPSALLQNRAQRLRHDAAEYAQHEESQA